MGTGLYLKRADRARYFLGEQGAGTYLNGNEFKLWFSAGDIPAGSLLKSVTGNIRLDTDPSGAWCSDLALAFHQGASPILQVGGYDVLPGVVTYVDWGEGYEGAGTVINKSFIWVTNFPDDIDLSAMTIRLWNGWIDDTVASWSGTLDFTWVPTP